jgi:isopenicillin-N epimerase
MRRRHFLTSLPALPALAACRSAQDHQGLSSLPNLQANSRTARELAGEESQWRAVQQAFAVDRSMVNFNNGGVSPSSEPVQNALKQLTAEANGAPSYVMWRLQEKRREEVRTALAGLLGTDPEQVAITRNTSEGLQICQFGMTLERGDQVLCCDQEYPRMINTFLQRSRRDGIELVRFPIPVPLTDPDEIVRRFEERITPRTRMLLVSQVINLTGQFLPVDAVCALGRKHGIAVIVDGAHGFAHVPFKMDDLDCDYYATSLHKWLSAPFGTGMLYVRKERIGDLWPLMAAPESRREDIRKFEEIGTHSLPLVLSILEAVRFHQRLGTENVHARLTYLRERWAQRIEGDERVRWNTDRSPGRAGGIANFGIEGVDSAALQKHLWQDHRIYTITIRHRGVNAEGQELPPEAPPQIDGLRVSPSFYSTLEEVDRFGAAIENVLEHGLPA